MKQRILILVIVILVAVSVTVMMTRKSTPRNWIMSSPEVRQRAIGFEQCKIMSANDYVRLSDLGDKVKQSHSISNGDLDWSLSLLNSRSDAPSIVHAKVFAVYLLLQNIPDVQERQIFDATENVIKHLPANDANSRYLDQKYCCAVFGILKDKRATPDVLPLINSENNHVRSQAHKTLKLMGYTDPRT
jgi:hypothetical protein